MSMNWIDITVAAEDSGILSKTRQKFLLQQMKFGYKCDERSRKILEVVAIFVSAAVFKNPQAALSTFLQVIIALSH